jgi:tight adherence protein B
MTDLLTPQVTVIALAVLAALSVGGLIYAVFFRRLRGESAAEKRLEQVTHSNGIAAAPIAARSQEAAAKRRRAVQESLREMELKEKARSRSRTSPPLELRLQQAGLNWSKPVFFIVGAVLGVVFFAVAIYIGAPIYAAIGIGAAGALGFPYWLINYIRKRRMRAFLHHFPGAVDIIVRGVKAGLPLNDCLRMVATESPEPVRSEFRYLHERQSMGMTVAEAIAELPDRVPLPEANFFALAITIQQQAGGNLSEALGNLSKVLRERARMVGKVKALSTEAKVSAYIIGALPVIVMLLVYLTSPDYIMTLFTEQVGNVILIASAIWMGIGVFVMRRMINFDF